MAHIIPDVGHHPGIAHTGDTTSTLDEVSPAWGKLALPNRWMQRDHHGVPLSFYIKCGNFNCLLLKRRFSRKVLMDKLPDDWECKAIHYILDKNEQQWFKCCVQGILFKKYKCTEVEKTAWFPQRSKSSHELPFMRTEAEACFKPRYPSLYDCAGSLCTHGEEQCVVMNKKGQDSHWPFKGRFEPSVNVYIVKPTSLGWAGRLAGRQAGRAAGRASHHLIQQSKFQAFL